MEKLFLMVLSSWPPSDIFSHCGLCNTKAVLQQPHETSLTVASVFCLSSVMLQKDTWNGNLRGGFLHLHLRATLRPSGCSQKKGVLTCTQWKQKQHLKWGVFHMWVHGPGGHSWVWVLLDAVVHVTELLGWSLVSALLVSLLYFGFL